MEPDELIVGLHYDFETSDGTVYENAALLEKHDDGSLSIVYGIAVVWIAEHELAGVEETK